MRKLPISYIALSIMFVFGACSTNSDDSTKVDASDTSTDDAGLGLDTILDVDEVDRTPPTIHFTAPLDGLGVSGDVVLLQAEAIDDHAVVSVEFFVDTVSVGIDVNRPYEANWSTTGLISGPYTLTAIAVDSAGNTHETEIGILLDVGCSQDGDCPPTNVKFITPVDRSEVCGHLTIEAAATDDTGIARVEFQVDGRPIGVAEESPYRVDWNTTNETDGSHTLLAFAYDEEGQAAFNSTMVEVRNETELCDNLPNLTLTSPMEGAFLRGQVAVTANASDDRGVTEVSFFVNNGLIANDAAIPYGFEWDTDEFPEGVYTVKALATDLAEQSSETQISVTIDRTSPSIEVLSPKGGWIDGPARLEAGVIDNYFVDRVEWYVDDENLSIEIDEDSGEIVHLDGTPFHVMEAPPFLTEIDVASFDSGVFELVAVAYDGVGLTASDRGAFGLNFPPDLEVVSPTDGSEITGPTTIRIAVEDDESNRKPDIVLLTVFVDGVEIHSERILQGDDFVSTNVDVPWVPDYVRSDSTILVEAVDRLEQVSTAELTVHVNWPFVVELNVCYETCFELNEGREVSGEVRFQADTDDDDGKTARVEFYVDGVLDRSLASAPWSWVWNSRDVSDGERVVRVVALNEHGESAEVSSTVRVNNCDVDDDLYVDKLCGGVDCNDRDEHINPEMEDDVGDNIDNNCDGIDGIDFDQDMFASLESGGADCDDTEDTIYPTSSDFADDDVDQNCDGADGIDGDGDGVASQESGGVDCDDSDPSITQNACGGCGPVPASVGKPCEGCGLYTCGDTADSVVCSRTICPGNACAADAECSTGECRDNICVLRLEEPRRLAVGGDCVYVLLESGIVEASNADISGQGESCPTPVGEFLSIDASWSRYDGSSFGCGIRGDGSIDCWGELLDNPPATAGRVWTDLSVGTAKACARNLAGSLFCWGTNLSTSEDPELWNIAVQKDVADFYVEAWGIILDSHGILHLLNYRGEIEEIVVDGLQYEKAPGYVFGEELFFCSVVDTGDIECARPNASSAETLNSPGDFSRVVAAPIYRNYQYKVCAQTASGVVECGNMRQGEWESLFDGVEVDEFDIDSYYGCALIRSIDDEYVVCERVSDLAP